MKDQILEEIKQFDTIIIHRHVRPDPDAYGSQCGLAEVLKASFPHKQIYVVGKPESSLQFLYEMNEIENKIYKEALVIICDTANEERVCDQRYKEGKKIIKIDHHPNEDAYGDLLWVDTDASSTSEMIFELYLHGKEQGLTLTDKGAQLIYAGIVGDTGRFLFPSTKPKTLEYASQLIQYNFEFKDLYDQLYNTKVNVAHLQGYVLQNFVMSASGVASMIISKEILQKYDVTPSDASQLVGILGNVEGIKAWAFFVEEDNLIRVRLRSKGPVINKIAQRYKGGGHPMAAGASIYDWEEVKSVLADLEDVCCY
ncbi:DHH family phosphoesterase [Metabacillus iocasae]|uniref:Phosphoesterase RecJ-like protein n=1 Tax=Priestia iocasae TaxID=2291674 RepID=A0ABS2QP59_9BACI|nr:bifunctional oligoribonuclease/PAP phosphatase NrnA [Metabacillus iocasae]MBM7701222.1 phosphoesterase RecJ-like protein [Metabacillus iocasae]